MIYRHRQKGTQYTLREVKTILRSQLTVEEYQSGIEGNDHLFLKTWGTIYNFIVKKRKKKREKFIELILFTNVLK